MPVSNPGGGGFTPSPGTTGGTFKPPIPGAPVPSQTSQAASKLIGQFESTAYGPPWNAMNGTGVTRDGTDLRPNKKVYGVAVDPSVIPLGTQLHIDPNPFGWDGTFKAFDTGGAIKGKRIDFYDWRGREKQMAWGKKTVQVYRASGPTSKMKPADKGGGLPSIDIPNPLNAVDEAAGAVKEFIGFLLSPRSLGGLLSKVVAMFLRLIFKAIWDYVVAPILHWHQRATIVYWRQRLGGSDEATGISAFVTISFWATGYAILWAKVDGDKKLVTEPGKTPLGSFLRSAGNTSARRKLVKPKDVKSKTPSKPEPVRSRASIVRMGTMAATRRRTVRVEGYTDELHRTDDPGTGTGEATPPAQGETGATEA